MREIKFRGKAMPHIGEDLWVQGYFFKDLCKGKLIPFITDGANMIPVMLDTIGQYTGLKDKNGKEIYEGDIISVNGKYPKLIRYIDEWASYCLANLTDLDCDLKTRHWQQVSPCWWTDYKREIKVIGNVYDNPELLKGGNHDHT